jgi:hypothetical protein
VGARPSIVAPRCGVAQTSVGVAYKCVATSIILRRGRPVEVRKGKFVKSSSDWGLHVSNEWVEGLPRQIGRAKSRHRSASWCGPIWGSLGHRARELLDKIDRCHLHGLDLSVASAVMTACGLLLHWGGE